MIHTACGAPSNETTLPQQIHAVLAEPAPFEPAHSDRTFRLGVLFEETHACVYDGRRHGIGTPIPLAAYSALPHLLMSFSGDFEGVVEAPLRRLKMKRHVVLSTTRFSTLPFYLKDSDTIATLPTVMAEQCARLFALTLSPTPVRIDSFPISMLWHARMDRDDGHAWLRGLVRECVRELLASRLDRVRPRRRG